MLPSLGDPAGEGDQGRSLTELWLSPQPMSGLPPADRPPLSSLALAGTPAIPGAAMPRPSPATMRDLGEQHLGEATLGSFGVQGARLSDHVVKGKQFVTPNMPFGLIF